MMQRDEAITHLANQFAELITEAELPATDSSDGLGQAVDAALRRLGRGESALASAEVADADVTAFLALCEYYTLRRIWRALATRGETSARQVLGPRSQIVQQVKDLVADAKEACEAVGYPVTTTSEWDFGHLNLDFIEPALSTE